MAKYLVETISMFRLRYVIETACSDYANDEVVTNDGTLAEFSQVHLDEIISSTREISDEEYLKLFDEEHPYLPHLTEDEKFRYVN